MKKSISIALMTISASAVSAEVELSCVEPVNTLMINHCATNELKVAKAELANYLQATLEHNSKDPVLLKSIKKHNKIGRHTQLHIVTPFIHNGEKVQYVAS